MGEDPIMKESNVTCHRCDSSMLLVKIKKYPGWWPHTLTGLGFFLSFLIVGPVVGIPLMLVGIYMLIGSQIVSICPVCGSYFKVMLFNPEQAKDT